MEQRDPSEHEPGSVERPEYLRELDGLLEGLQFEDTDEMTDFRDITVDLAEQYAHEQRLEASKQYQQLAQELGATMEVNGVDAGTARTGVHISTARLWGEVGHPDYYRKALQDAIDVAHSHGFGDIVATLARLWQDAEDY